MLSANTTSHPTPHTVLTAIANLPIRDLFTLAELLDTTPSVLASAVLKYLRSPEVAKELPTHKTTGLHQ